MEVVTFRNISLRVIVILALTGLAGVGSCAREESEGTVQGRDKPLPDQVISGFAITETSMGKKDWTMEAEEAYLYEKRNILEAREVEVTFYDDSGGMRSVLQADYGKLNRNSDDMEARGSVTVTGSDGIVLETESLVWQSATRQIVSDDSVRIIRNEDVLTGWGFRGDPDLGSFSILRNMRATIRALEETEEGDRTDEPSAAD
jgi:LPS export ABC transporter protein LptC